MLKKVFVFFSLLFLLFLMFPKAQAQAASYTCQISADHTPLTQDSFTGRIVELSPNSGYDTTEWHMGIVGSQQSSGSTSEPIVGTNSALSFTFQNLQPNTSYSFYAVRKDSHGINPDVRCGAGGGTNNGSVRTPPASGTPTPTPTGPTSTVTITPTPIPGTPTPTGGPVIYAKQSPYLTPYNPGIGNILWQGVVVATIFTAVYLLF